MRRIVRPARSNHEPAVAPLPPLAYSLLPTDGAPTYRVRQSLFTALVLTPLLLGVALMRRRS